MSLPLKLAVISTTVLSTAVMFNLLSPFNTNYFSISELWTSLISWLKPPYLYVVINFIIIAIVASSRLQSKIDGCDRTMSSIPIEPVEPLKVMLPVEMPPVHEPVIIMEPVVMAAAGYAGGAEFVHVSEPDFSKTATEVYKDIKENSVDKTVISMSTWTPAKINEVDVSFPVGKPPAYARFRNRKPAKATTEGGKTLGVSKPKPQDTLDATWKTITEARSVPLTRHVRKSDTWESHGNSRQINNSDELLIDHHSGRMTKFDTFDVHHGGSRKPPPPPPSKLSWSGGSGSLKKEPSLGPEELNRRVEAFIKKFNENMRLERQESLNQYTEMINRGAH